ncbi:hypothetical protein [Nostoc commune]|uniref:hypothetical protein n=1 Tax=Nostoc commune TaxID=1178 RepID=UPI002072F774|nr:hypothetical protein [Nostoc commune]
MNIGCMAIAFPSQGARGKLYCIIAGSSVSADINMELDIITIVNPIAKATLIAIF